MNPRAEQLKGRAKRFALRIMGFLRDLPMSEEGRVLGNQLLKSATSVAANCRSACRARSKAEFLSKLGVVVEEADETVLWLELLRDGRIVFADKVAPHLEEADELLAIFAASQRTARGNSQTDKS